MQEIFSNVFLSFTFVLIFSWAILVLVARVQILGTLDRDRAWIMSYSGIPGIGQLINGEIKKGILFLVIDAAAYVMLCICPDDVFHQRISSMIPWGIFLIVVVVFQIYAFYDAVFVGYKKSENKLNVYEKAELQMQLNEDAAKGKPFEPLNERVCQECGAVVSDKLSICPKCGHRLPVD